MRFGAAIVVAGSVLVGCGSGDKGRPSPSGNAPTSSASAVPLVPREPPTPAADVTFETSDKVPLSGTLYLAKNPAAPVLVFVHRFRGDRQEWAPLAARLASADKRYTMINFDLRGHGQSKSSSGKKRLDWADMKEKDAPALVRDVRAALDYGFAQSEGKSNRAVVVGSSLGAALGARAASQEERVVAIGMVSPGAAIQDFDVYHPFADVREMPSFIAGAKDDNVAREPVDGLARMAKEQGTVKVYDGKGHGALGLEQEGDLLFTDLEQWLMGVFDTQAVARTIVPDDDTKKKGHKG